MNIVILAGFLVTTVVSQSNGAAMIPEHPQTAFCKADFGKVLFNAYSLLASVYVSLCYYICIRH